MELDLSKINAVEMPKTAELLKCSNGTFTINSIGIITFTYTHTPDAQRIAEIEEEIASAEAAIASVPDWVKSKEDSDMIASLCVLISDLKSDKEWEETTIRTTKFKCTWITDELLPDRLARARSATKDNVWSVARATGLEIDWFKFTSNPEFSWKWTK